MESMTSYKKVQPTYAELAKALLALSLKNKSQGEVFSFSTHQGEPIVLLPLKPESEKVNMARFIAISYNLADLGILNHPHDLGKIIEQMRLSEKTAAA
jgi:hypothetical protein